MGTTTVVEAARRALGPAGVFLPFSRTSASSADLQREAVRRLERAGYRAVWTNGAVGGKDALVQLAVLLAATERMVFGTGIANIWARAPQTAHGAAALLAQAFPGRFVLGLGVGYPHQAASVGREFGSPVATMRGYLDQMAAPAQLPAPDVAYPKIIGANGPKMLALSGEIADGALPAMAPPEFTAQARQLVGPGKLWWPGWPSSRTPTRTGRRRPPGRRLPAGSASRARTRPPWRGWATRSGRSPR
jgi:probable F420-dependent oxidoreductase